MGTLAQTLGKSITIDVLGMSVEVKQLSINDLFDCMRQAFREFEERPKPIDEMAQEAIETGRIPITSVAIIIKRACKSLDESDVEALLSGKNYTHALKIASAAMGNEASDEGGAAKKAEAPTPETR